MFSACLQATFQQKQLDKTDHFVWIDETNVFGLMVVAMAIGFAVASIAEPYKKTILNLFTAIFEVIMRLISATLKWFAPFGICSLLASTLMAKDLAYILEATLWLMLTVISGCLVMACILISLFSK